MLGLVVCCLLIIFFGSIFLLVSGAFLLAASTVLLVTLLPTIGVAGFEAAALFRALLARFGPFATDFAIASALLIERFFMRLDFGDGFLSVSSSLDDESSEELDSRLDLLRSRCFSFAARFLLFSCDSSLYRDRSTVVKKTKKIVLEL